MPMRRESGSASGTGPKKKIRKVRQNKTTSSLGSNAAAAHGYKPTSKPIPRQAPAPRQDLRQAAAKDQADTKEAAYVKKMRVKAPAEAARQQKIVNTEKALNSVATKGRIKYDPRTGNYVQHRKRALLPDEDVVVDPKTKDVSKDLDASQRQAGIKHAETVAPALKVLNETQRPVRAVAGGVDAALKGKGTAGILKAQKKGLLNNKGPTFGKVLKDQGVPKGIASVAGFGLDVAADPTTYVTGGSGKVAVKGAEKAAADAAKRAARNVAEDTEVKTAKGSRPSEAGGSENLRKTVQKAAAKKAVRQAGAKGDSTGIVVRFAGKELPGVRSSTAAIGRGVKRVVPARVRTGTKETVAHVRPQITPTGVTKAEHVLNRQTERRARAQRSRGVREAQALAEGWRGKLTPEEWEQVQHAIETRKIGKLPDHLHQPAVEIRSANRAALRERRAAGVSQGDVRTVAQARHERVPAVTADPVASKKLVSKEQRREAKIEKILRESKAAERVAQGRSEILSRNVGGRRAEVAAQRAGNPRLAAPKTASGGAPPVPAGHVRLYRGEGVHVRSGKDWPDAPAGGASQGRWFTADIKRASGYADEKQAMRKGYVKYVDVPEDVARAAKIEDGHSTFVLPDEVARQAGELKEGSYQAARSEADRRTAGAARAGEVSQRRNAARAAVEGREPRRAGGGVGVAQAQKQIAIAERRLKAARGRVEAATSRHEREVALEAQQKAARQVVEARVAVARTAPKEYVPHMRASEIEGTAGKATGGTRGGTRRIGSTMTRDIHLPVREANKKLPEDEAFSTNVPLVQANYRVQTANAVAGARMARDLGERAAKVVPGKTRDIPANHAVYRLAGGKLDEVDDAELAALAAGKGTMHGRLVHLNKQAVDSFKKSFIDDRTNAGKGFDFVQSKWKRAATFTPGFHIRNMIGDTQMAYLAQPGHRLPVNAAQAGKALKRMTQREAHLRKTGVRMARDPNKTIKVAGQHVNLDDFLDGAINEGVIRSGMISRGIDDVAAEGRVAKTEAGGDGVAADVSGKTRKAIRQAAATGKLGAPLRTVKRGAASANRGMQNREDLMRLATYKHGLDGGLTPAEAADLASAFHIDYGDVTEFERKVARRAAPFYTFSARALPVHAKALVNTPGKIAAIEKARQELAYGMGIDDGWEGDTPEWKQRAVPFGVKVKGEKVALDAALPVSMLNELPTSVNPKDYALEMWKFSTGLLTPAVKIPIEVGTGQSLFFRKPIKDKYKPYVSAPGWVNWLPENVRNGLGVVSITDNRSGKQVPGWDPWTNYAFRQLPGLATQFQQITTPGALQSGRHDWQKVSGVLGVKADPIDSQTAKITALFDMRNKLDTEKTQLGKQPGGGGGMSSANPRTRTLTKKLADIDYQIYKLSVERGDAVPQREGAIKNKKLLKPRVKQRGILKKGDQRAAAKKSGSSGWGGGSSTGSGW